ncbi:helix-turn-helix transcriptional regulator [Streptomyces sp. NBC_01198]|uniref:helix-turn-helix transcriptional regulator n=1 Tax=Streptomyces sp. NBC_01198 TaxID=2903769 RepID=UPI002E134AEB|nr:helix-turn-helix domain-containing protein [Streptomyces sp. NBC_01198]
MSALPDHFLTPEELADVLRLPSVETVYAWRKKRTGPPGFRVGKHLRYDPDAVRTWIDQQTQAA